MPVLFVRASQFVCGAVLTRRGERLIGALLSLAAVVALMAVFGIAGWIEGGM